MTRNSDITNGNTDIEIIGGEFDGNRAQQTSATRGIFVERVNHSRIEGVYVHNIRDRGVQVYNSTDVHVLNSRVVYAGVNFQQAFCLEFATYSTIENCYAEDGLDHGFILAYTQHCAIINCVSVTTGAYGATNGCGGTEVYSYGTNYATNNTIHGLTLINPYGGFGICNASETHIDGLTVISPRKNVVSPTLSGNGMIIYGSQTSGVYVNNVRVIDPELNGIHIATNAPHNMIFDNIKIIGGDATEQWVQGFQITDWAYDIQVSNIQVIDFQGQNGIRVQNAGNVTISNVLVKNSRLIGISLVNATWCTIMNGILKDDQVLPTQGWGINEQGALSDYNVIIGITAIDNTVGGILIVGTNTNVNLCWNGTTAGWIP